MSQDNQSNLQDKQNYIDDLIEDFAVLHNLYIKNASHMKQIHSILMGMQNALQSGMYDELELEEFKKIISKDLTDIMHQW